MAEPDYTDPDYWTSGGLRVIEGTDDYCVVVCFAHMAAARAQAAEWGCGVVEVAPALTDAQPEHPTLALVSIEYRCWPSALVPAGTAKRFPSMAAYEAWVASS